MGVWVVATPIVGLVYLFKAFQQEYHKGLRTYFLILYQGFKPELHYWEFVNSLRKFLILISFLLPDSLKSMFACMVLLAVWRLQDILQPYKLKHNNSLDTLGVKI